MYFELSVLLFWNLVNTERKQLRRKNKITIIRETERFVNIDSAVISIIHQYMQGGVKMKDTSLHILMMTTAESMLSKRPVLRIILTLFSSMSDFFITVITKSFLVVQNFKTDLKSAENIF